MWKQLCTFCSCLFFKVWGCGYVRDKWEDRRRGGKTSGAQYVLSAASPAHLQWEAHMGFPERLVAAAASLSCGSWSNKGGVWIIPRIPAVPLVTLVRFVQRHNASLAWWLQWAFSLFERFVTAQRKGVAVPLWHLCPQEMLYKHRLRVLDS